MFDQMAFLGNMGEIIPIVAITGGLVIALVAIVGGMIHCHLETRQREQTKREVAAYIAEGSMTPEEGERILAAGNKKA